MKKFLLIFLTIGIVGSLTAQQKRLQVRNFKKYTAKKVNLESQIPTYQSEPNDYVSASRDMDIVVGETYYDLQTNSSVPRHIYAYDDGTMGTVWTMSFNTDNFPQCLDRGTGYNYYDGTTWGDYPTEEGFRIDGDVRTGWPSYQPYGANGEIVCAHSGTATDGLVFSWRENKGTGDWNHFELFGPADHEDIIWPRMATSGENRDIIHVIALTTPSGLGGTVYEGLDGALLYSRSTDGGQTWDPENVILDGLTADDIQYISADTYAWAEPRDGVIAFVEFTGPGDGMVFKSEDDGDTWEKMTFYQSPYPLNDAATPFDFVYYDGDGSNDILIDDEGKIHVAFGRTVCGWDYTNNYMYYSYGVDGLIYWNEDMPALDSTLLGDTDALEAGGYLAAYVDQDPETGDTVHELTTYGGGMTSMPQMVLTNATTRDGNNIPIITIVYMSYAVGFEDTEEGNDRTYRHIWKVSTEGDGKFSYPFEDLTGDIFHLHSECAFPSISQNVVGNTISVQYQTDPRAGNALQPTTPSHAAVLNNMVYLPISPLPVGVKENRAPVFDVAQNQPNPAVGQTTVLVNTQTLGEIDFTISNLLGQVVYRNVNAGRTLGGHAFNVDVSSFDSGIYVYTVKMGDKTVTKKMLVE